MAYNLKEVRDSFKISQEDLATRAGLSVAAISAMENIGSVPTQATSKKLAKAYGVPAFILRTIAVLAAEGRPDAGKQRDRHDEIVRLCREAVSQRTNGRKKN